MLLLIVLEDNELTFLSASNYPFVSKPSVVVVVSCLSDLLELGQLLEAGILYSPHFPVLWARCADDLVVLRVDRDFSD